MKQQTFGATLAALRKEKGMTQLVLAEKMGVTDKAVSKWERDLSLPDAGSFPKLAEVLGVTVDALMQANVGTKETPSREPFVEMTELILKGVALAMSVAVVVLSLIDRLETDAAIRLLGIGLACLSAAQFVKKE